MEQSVREALCAGGVNVDEALERFMGNEALLNRFLKKFPDDANYGKLVQAVEAGDREGALTASHTLKGVCGNLSLAPLHALLTDQVGLLRAGDWDAAAALMPRLAQAYDRAVAAIRSACP